jgi:undecaprenyl diphosphate synthase
MDGNGRWAKARGKTRLAGHRAGVEAVRDVVTAAAELGVEVLTLYAFSSENWSRPASEVKGLFRLLETFVRKETPELLENRIRLRSIGRLDEIPQKALLALRRAEAETAGCDRMTLVLALNYGAQDEIVDSARSLAREALSGRMSPGDIGREDVERGLHTAGMPPVDLLVRTGGEFRLSNFLLWQVSYAELYFTPVNWPDFRRRHLEEAIGEFGRRERRFGGR